MKQTILSIFLLVTILCNAQIPGYKKVANLSESKVIVGLTGSVEQNNLKEIVDKFWTVCPVLDAMPLKQAREKAKKDPNLYVIYLDKYTSRSFKKYEAGKNFFSENAEAHSYRNISIGSAVSLSDGGAKPILRSDYAQFDNDITIECIAHAVNYMNQIMTIMVNDKVGGMKAYSTMTKAPSDLADMTLYIPEWWLGKLTKEDIAKTYDGKFEIVDHAKWANAIYEKQKGIAYIIIVPTSVGGNLLHRHHLCNAETGRVYDVFQNAGVALNGINMSKGNKGYIEKKHLKDYAKKLKN